MKAAVLKSPNKLSILDVPIPELNDGETLIRVKCTGICGTDALVYKGLHRTTMMPVTLGHECAGIIEAIKGDPLGFKAGEHVFSRGSWGCGTCVYCLMGTPALCKNRKMLGVDVNGTMAEYVKLPTSALFHLSGNVLFEAAQSLISISCAINLTHKFEKNVGMNAAIYGPGHNGLIILQLLRLLGFDKIVMVGGQRKEILKTATALGADMTVSYNDPDIVEKIREHIPGGPQIVVECSGSGQALSQALQIAANGGKILVFSIYGKPVDGFQAQDFYNKELSILGVKGAGSYYKDAERLLSKGLIKIEPLITHRFKLEQTEEAFKIRDDKSQNATRIIIASSS